MRHSGLRHSRMPAANAMALLSAMIHPAAAIMAPFALGVLAHEWRRAAGRYRALSAQLATL